MKQPIEPSDIRAGDLIRWESLDGEEAHETRIGDPRNTGFTEGNHYLLDRPEPAVELPTEPTLGVLEWDGGLSDDDPRKSERRWFVDGETVWCENANETHSNTCTVDRVRSFTRTHALPVDTTAVPTAALDELRGWIQKHKSDITYDFSNDGVELVDAFLATIDEAAS